MDKCWMGVCMIDSEESDIFETTGPYAGMQHAKFAAFSQASLQGPYPGFPTGYGTNNSTIFGGTQHEMEYPPANPILY